MFYMKDLKNPLFETYLLKAMSMIPSMYFETDGPSAKANETITEVIDSKRPHGLKFSIAITIQAIMK